MSNECSDVCGYDHEIQAQWQAAGTPLPLQLTSVDYTARFSSTKDNWFKHNLILFTVPLPVTA